MMKNITTTTNTINKNTPSLRERTHELAKAQKKAKDCEAYILICQNEINEINNKNSGRSGRADKATTLRRNFLNNEIRRAQKGLLRGDVENDAPTVPVKEIALIKKHKKSLATPLSPPRGATAKSKRKRRNEEENENNKHSLSQRQQKFVSKCIKMHQKHKKNERKRRLIYYPRIVALDSNMFGVDPVCIFDPTLFNVNVKCVKCSANVKKNGLHKTRLKVVKHISHDMVLVAARF